MHLATNYASPGLNLYAELKGRKQPAWKKYPTQRVATTIVAISPISKARTYTIMQVQTQSAVTQSQLPIDHPPTHSLSRQLGSSTAPDWEAALPKAEIGGKRFLSEHPSCDGRNVVIAILDTGVDPGAAGLQITSDGKPKVLDVIDCSGSGDIEMSKVVTADSAGFIVGSSGHKLLPNTAWTNPSGEWRVGHKHAYELFSNGLTSRIKEERRKEWDEGQRLLVTAAGAALAAFDRLEGPSAKLSDAKKKERAELEGRQALLKEMMKNYEDAGPLLDAVVWHDGSVWRAALDTSDLCPRQYSGDVRSKSGSNDRSSGKLADATPMTNYRLERQHGTFSERDQCNYAVNIYDDGAVLSIAVDAGAHGTHVAGIAAAHFPDDPSSNGLAPGAQIISCKIGDSRLGSLETGTALTRALIAVLDHKADLVNMSYGEPTTTPNAGRFIELATELVHKHGVIFVASAGNAGPALSTVGAPGGTSSGLYSIGAFVSPALALAGHSVRPSSSEAGQQYTWSSRGPTPDGHVGVAFSAPGGAIAPVPRWTLQRKQLMNGTSMSSPNACGGIALLLSGLKATGGLISPSRVRSAIEATCLPLGNGAPDAVLTYGRGMLQVDAAFKYLQHGDQAAAAVTSDSSARADVRYEVTVAPSEDGGVKGRPAARGIYLREPHQSLTTSSWSCTVTPRLHEDAANSLRIDVEERVLLQPTAPWLSTPPILLLMHSGRNFEVRVDAAALPPGLHYAEVVGSRVAATGGPLAPAAAQTADAPAGAGLMATHAPAAGDDVFNDAGEKPALAGAAEVLFRLPVTVIKALQVPTSLPNLSLGTLAFSAGVEHRHFVAVPEGATWAEILLKAGAHDTAKVYLFRATQLRPGCSYRESETRTQMTMTSNAEHIMNVPVSGASTLELTTAQFWSSSGESQLSVDIHFHGVVLASGGDAPEDGSNSCGSAGVAVDASEGPRQVLVRAPLRNERVKPEAKLTTMCIPLRPSEAVLEPLPGARDVLPDGRTIHRLLLTYKLNVTEAGKHKCCLMQLNGNIYDAVVESHFSMVHDANKKLLASADAIPDYVQLGKGDHTIRVQLRHDSVEVLDKLKTLPMVVKRKLENAISLPVHGSKKEALVAGQAMGETTLRGGDTLLMYIGMAPDDKLPKDASAGHLLTGTLSLGQLRRSGSGVAPAKLSLSYLLPAVPGSSKGNTDNSSNSNGTSNGSSNSSSKEDAFGEEPPKAAAERLQAAVRDAQIKFLKELKLSDPVEAELYSSTVSTLRSAYPGHLPLLSQHLRSLDAVDKQQRATTAHLTSIVAAADDVIEAIDQTQLAVSLSVKCPEETAEAKRAKKEVEERKTALIDALTKKLAALLELETLRQVPAEAATIATSVAPVVAAGIADGVLSVNSDSGEQPDSPRNGSDATGSPAIILNFAEAEGVDDSSSDAWDATSSVAAPVVPHGSAGSADEVAATAGTASSHSVPPPAMGEADAVAAAFKELRRYVDTGAESSHLLLHAKVEARSQRYASALRAVDKLLSDDKMTGSKRDAHDMRASLYSQLGWHMWAEHEASATQHVHFPASYPLF